MATLPLPLTILSLVAAGIVAGHNVTISLLDSAIARGADGTPPAYAYSPGFGDGYDNWHVFLQNVDACLDRARSSNGSSAKLMSTQNGIVSFGGMLDANSTFNPDFYNWHVVKIFYCDGSSLMSDVEDVDPKYNLTYRGARIYDAMMDELLRIGMGNAKNALLSGTSADFRYTFINTLKSTIKNSSSRRGYFVHSCYQHGHMEYKRRSTCSSFVGNGLANKTIAQAVGDWFFDRSEFQEMDMLNDLPRNCTSFDDQPTLEKNLVVMSDSVKVDLKECYKIWDDDCKFGLLKEICNDISDHPQNVCCGFLRNNRMDLDCYFAIVDDLKNNYSCQHPDVATGRASDILTDCQG
ncbi:hypothetical protein SASPL_126808 [Salvia splendens]|uniref:Pectin acetylesterase n=1 Tax=Salvia splendens TaxID=180675 RepID=A0A8X8XGB6_SALSN|nr:hypothetical protein SASPL_126808 [Salvia splendens]